MKLPDEIQTTLLQCGEPLRSLSEPWWIIGSTAVALHGVDPGPINDVDFLISPNDAKFLERSWGFSNWADTGSNRFRSQFLFKPKLGTIRVEIMAGLEIRNNGKWHALSPRTRQKLPLAGNSIYLPDRSELVEILRLFGRDKDLARADLLDP